MKTLPDRAELDRMIQKYSQPAGWAGTTRLRKDVLRLIARRDVLRLIALVELLAADTVIAIECIGTDREAHERARSLRPRPKPPESPQ